MGYSKNAQHFIRKTIIRLITEYCELVQIYRLPVCFVTLVSLPYVELLKLLKNCVFQPIGSRAKLSVADPEMSMESGSCSGSGTLMLTDCQFLKITMKAQIPLNILKEPPLLI